MGAAGQAVLAEPVRRVQTVGHVLEAILIDTLALAGYAFAMSITPGPNNVMLAASGANFGFRRTVPHMLGISVGFAAQAILVCTGFGVVIAQSPVLQGALAWVGAAAIAWMGWRLLRSGSVDEVDGSAGPRPLSALEAALFQYANPKAWVMAVTIAAVFLPRTGDPYLSAMLMFIVLVAVIIPCTVVWAAFGSTLRGYLHVPARRRAFNAAMAVLLLLTAVAMLMSQGA